MIRPPISYPGAKFKAMDQIIPLIPDGIEDWREPFFGGGSMTLYYMQSHKFSAKKLTVSELNPEVWAFWQGTKLYAHQVADLVKETVSMIAPTALLLSSDNKIKGNTDKLVEKAFNEGRELWDWSQSLDVSNLSIIDRAARFFIANRISNSGLTDGGAYMDAKFKGFRLSWADTITDIQPLLQNIEIKNVSYEELLKDVDPVKTFIIMDPPYWKVGGAPPGKWSKLYGTSKERNNLFDHELFAKNVQNLECRWFVTYDDSVKIRKLFEKNVIRPYTTQYVLAGKNKSEDALAGEELFIANYNILDEEYDTLPEDF